MMDTISHIGFIGPGGPEFLVIMLVLLLLFGSKDAPRIFRKINEFINSVRNTADSFKREIMYSDLETGTSESSYGTDDPFEHDEDYDYDEESSYLDDLEGDYSDETFSNLEKDLESSAAADGVDEADAAGEGAASVEAESSESGDNDVQKA